MHACKAYLLSMRVKHAYKAMHRSVGRRQAYQRLVNSVCVYLCLPAISKVSEQAYQRLVKGKVKG